MICPSKEKVVLMQDGSPWHMVCITFHSIEDIGVRIQKKNIEKLARLRCSEHLWYRLQWGIPPLFHPINRASVNTKNSKWWEKPARQMSSVVSLRASGCCSEVPAGRRKSNQVLMLELGWSWPREVGPSISLSFASIFNLVGQKLLKHLAGVIVCEVCGTVMMISRWHLGYVDHLPD